MDLLEFLEIKEIDFRIKINAKMIKGKQIYFFIWKYRFVWHYISDKCQIMDIGNRNIQSFDRKNKYPDIDYDDVYCAWSE